MNWFVDNSGAYNKVYNCMSLFSNHISGLRVACWVWELGLIPRPSYLKHRIEWRLFVSQSEWGVIPACGPLFLSASTIKRSAYGIELQSMVCLINKWFSSWNDLEMTFFIPRGLLSLWRIHHVHSCYIWNICHWTINHNHPDWPNKVI